MQDDTIPAPPDAPHVWDDVVEALADGAPVDWESHTGDGEIVDCLRALARIDAVCAGDRPGGARPAVLFRWGHLEVIERLGAGSFGEVFRAWDAALERDVALKLRRADVETVPGLHALHLDEARRLARVRHPHVLTVFGAAVHDGRPGLWAEIVDGESLEAALTRGGPFGAEETREVARTLCGALTAVHAAGLVHGDVKPANVMRARGGRLVLMDFGAASEDVRRGADALRAAQGTPGALAPEVRDGAPPSVASDLYAVGATCARLLTGAWPSPGTTLRDARPDAPRALLAVLERALAAEPHARFASAGEMEQALETSRAAAPPRAPRRPWGLLAAACAVIAAGALWANVRRPAPSPPAQTARVEPAPVTAAPAPHTAATSTAPAPAPATAAPRASVRLVRRRGLEERDLRPDDLIGPGDRLSAAVTLDAPGFVYVLSEDARGDFHVLFPLPGFDRANPLPRGADIALPGTVGGAAADWEVTTHGGGRETIAVVVSRTRLAALETALAREDHAAIGAPVRDGDPTFADGIAQALRGIGGVHVERAAGGEAGTRLRQLAAAWQAAGAPVWARTMELRNP